MQYYYDLYKDSGDPNFEYGPVQWNAYREPDDFALLLTRPDLQVFVLERIEQIRSILPGTPRAAASSSAGARSSAG